MAGTAPAALGDAEVFGRLRQAAVAGTDPSLGWVEYGAEPGCDLDDELQWGAANPGRVEWEAIMSERRELSPEDFAKERLNIWPTDQTDHVFGPDVWVSLAAARRDDIANATAVAVDHSPDGLVVVAAAYRNFDAGTTHVEVSFVRDQVTNMGEALDWLLANTKRRVPVVIDGASTAAVAISLLDGGEAERDRDECGRDGPRLHRTHRRRAFEVADLRRFRQRGPGRCG